MTKRKRVTVPLCSAHKNHWLTRQAVILGGLVVSLGLGFAVVVATSGPGQDANSPLGGLACLAFPVLLVLWLVVAGILTATSIRPQEITHRSIALVGVSPEFVRALEDGRGDPRRVDEAAREHWRGGTRGVPGAAPTDHIRPRDEGRPDPGAYRE